LSRGQFNGPLQDEGEVDDFGLGVSLEEKRRPEGNALGAVGLENLELLEVLELQPVSLVAWPG